MPVALEPVEVVANDRVAEGVGLMRLHCPGIGAEAQPGRFVQLRIRREASFILRRPFSVHAASEEGIEILYQVLGVGTRELSLLRPGARMDAVGPLGNGFSIPDGTEHALVVAGGLGCAPLLFLVRELSRVGVAVTVAFGAPTRDRLVRLDAFSALARRVEPATDDGSEGRRGLVTDLVPGLIEDDAPDIIYSCGPEPMSRTVAEQAVRAGVPCEVSLERLMACGIGACLSCVVTTVDGRERACVEGPVFDAERVVWGADG